MKPFQPKPKECKQCRSLFTPVRAMAVVCSPICAIRLGKAKKAQEKVELKARKEAVKRLSEWEDECQAIVNKIARLRDRNDGCISCHLPASWGGQWHGSHFRSVGAASAVRFNLWNIHKSCSACNYHKCGNIAEYEPRLVAKIGQEKVDWLKAQNQITRYRVDYLKRFKAVMGKKLRRLEKSIERQS